MNKGNLVIVGGGINKSWDIILGEFVKLAGPNPSICIVATASQVPMDSYNSIKSQFIALGVAAENICLMPVSFVLKEDTWADFASSEFLKYLDGASGVWFTGGDQMHLLKAFINSNGTPSPCLEKIHEIYASGGVIGGTSAGAAIMSTPMITRGGDKGALLSPICTNCESYDDNYQECDEAEPILITQGLGFIVDAIVDQHFNTRPRLQRLISAMEFTSTAKGYGISEDTALVISSSSINVIGSAYVTVIHIDGKNKYSIEKIYGNSHS